MTLPVVSGQIEFDLLTRPPVAAVPPQRAPEPRQSLAHAWIVAAEIRVEERVAKLADFRGSFPLTAVKDATRVDALETYCRNCRRPYQDVAGADCEALIDNRHLIGGDQTVRAKRKIPTPPPGARLIRGASIQRRGIGAYVAGVSRPR